MLDFDDMLVQVGEFGIYQKALFAFQAPFCMFVTFVLFGQLFMILYPETIWCEDHYACVDNNLTNAFQRHNLSFSFTGNRPNPCFMNNIERRFMRGVMDNVRSGSRPCPGHYWHPSRTDNPANVCAPAMPTPAQPQRRKRQSDYWSKTTTGSWRRTTKWGQWSGPPYKGVVDPYKGQEQGYGEDQTETEEWATAPYQSTTERWRSTPRRTTFRGQGSTASSSRSTTRRPGQGQGQGQTESDRLAGSNEVEICESTLTLTLPNTTRIFMPNFDPLNASAMTSGAIFGRSPNYVRIESCSKIAWNRTRSVLPYNTIVTDGNWWCNAEAWVTASQSVFYLGAIVGGFLIGFIADNYGRVPALVMANLLGAVGGALSVVTTNFYLFMVFRFITGMAFDNCFTMMYILVLEFCGPTYRTLVANLSIAVFYTLGTIILPLLALWLQNWQIFGLVISLPMLLGLLAIFLVPESARWLLSKGRAREATDILRSFAKVNRKKVDERVFVEFENDAQKTFQEIQQDEEESSFTAALRTPRLRRTFILLTLIWSLIALVYDGHSRNVLNLADENWDLFSLFMIASATEFPADMLLIFTLDRFGRRWLSFGSLTLSGAASIIAAAIPANVPRMVSLVMAIISRFFVNVAFNIGLQYAAELLPTVIRAQGVNAIHIMGYVASIISPFVASLGRTDPRLSLILLGTFAIAGGFLSLFLAETLGEDLPNTLEEAEAFGMNQSFWNCPICAKPKDEEHVAIEEPANMEVMRRNNLRAAIRGESYRSSIISSSSRGSRRFPNIALNPAATPSETTRLRRITH